MAVKSPKMKLSFYIFVFTLFAAKNAEKLTVPRILLPYNTGIPTNYTLEVKEGNCYKWSSSRYDLVSLTPFPSPQESESCTTKVIVSSVSRYPERDNAIILAEDEKSGQILRCDVVIDAIHSIEIVTTTRVLFLEDAPEVFEVIAKNDQGDTFSSLEGLAFQWSHHSEIYASDGHGVLRFLKFADSKYKTPPSIVYWEKQNLHGSMILMEGLKTGSAKVSVKPLDLAYKNIMPHEVSLIIVANLNLKPSHIYLLPGTTIQYHLELVKQGKAYPVSLPSEQYYLEVVNASIAVLDTSVSRLTALRYGSTNVVVKDRYVTSKEIAYLPSAVVHVTVPSYMTFSIYPGDKWSLQEEKQYFISVNIYDRNSYPIHITGEVNVVVHFPSKYFRVVSSTQNGTFHEIFTLTHGSCQISAQLNGVNVKDRLRKLEMPITASQDVIIHEKIKVIPAITLLPWDSVAKPSYTVNLTATGGTGSYNWMSNKPSLASVDNIIKNKQSTRVTTFGEGEVTIFATDSHIPLFSGFANISIQKAVSLQLLPKEVEVHVNEILSLPVVMYGYLKAGETEKVMFSDCTKLPLVVDIHEVPKFKYLKEDGPPTGVSCRTLKLKCHTAGYDRIRVQYGIYKDTVVISCYKKLKPVHPESEIVNALGSSADVVFEGGPKPWLMCKANFYAELTVNESVLKTSYQENATDVAVDHHIHNTLCRGFGEADVELSVGNKPCQTNLYPLSNTAAVKVICAIPQVLVIEPVFTTVAGRKCPASADEMIVVHNRYDILLEIIVKDSFSRPFYNISSLVIKWFISNKLLAHLEFNEGFHTKVVPKLGYQSIERHYQELHPYGVEGELKVTATIVGYKPEVLQKYDITTKPDLHTPISYTLKLKFVEEVEVSPRRLSLFNNPSNKVEINITKGSGNFHVEVSDASKARVIYVEGTRKIQIIPLDTGSFTVTVFDLCVSVKKEAVAHVHVYGISSILLDVVDKVEMGKSVLASVEVLNEDKQNIPASVFSLMNLQPVMLSDVISVRLASIPGPDQIYALYHVSGIKLGQTILKFESSLHTSVNGHQYESESQAIQVFSPLVLHPRNITLVIGSIFQVICTGGPHPQSTIEYLIEEPDKALVSTGGRVEAKKLGKTILVAQSVGYDKRGQQVIFSQDKALIHVVSLSGIKIHSPLTRMIAGSEMNVYALGLTDQETPFSFGSAVPGFEFKWSVSNEKVVSVHNVYTDIDMVATDENNFCVRVQAEHDGFVTLRLDMFVRGASHDRKAKALADEVQVQVFKKLKLINPEYDNGMILLSPKAQLKLKTNRFVPTKVSYHISSPDGNMNPVATIDGQGLLVASTRLGTATLTVIAVEDFGITQYLTVVVKVEDIAYLMLKPVIEARTKNQQLSSVPVGFSIPFIVTYHDNVGHVFNAVTSQLKYQANRLDLTSITFGSRNDTLVVQTLKPGLTVLKVWDSQSFVPPDYMKISAGFSIDPTDAEVIVGDVICFGSPLLTHEGHAGTWTSDSPILGIHPSSGGAVALATGTTTVTYYLSSSYSTSTQVTVLPVDKISLLSGSLQYVTNADPAKSYKIQVVLESISQYRGNNVIGKNCSAATPETLPLPHFWVPFYCELSFNASFFEIKADDVFSVESGFDIADGAYFCLITAREKVPSEEISTVDAHLLLSVHPVSAGRGVNFVSEHLALPFFPAFFVHDQKLTLSDYHSSAFIVSAIPVVQDCLQVLPSDKSILEVMPSMKSLSSISFPVRFVGVSQYHPHEYNALYLDIICPKTKQHVRLPVYLKFHSAQYDSGQCYLPPVQYTSYDWQWLAAVAGIVVLILFCTYVCKSVLASRRVTVTSQPVFLNSSANGSFSPLSSRLSPSPHQGRLSPQDALYETLGQPRRLWSVDSPPQGGLPRRRQTNVYQ